MIVPQSPQCILKRPLQLVSRAPYRLVQGCPRVCDGCGLTTLEPGLDHAVFVIWPVLAGVQITQVDFHPGDLIAEMNERVLHRSLDVGCESIATGYIFVGTDLDVHLWCRRNAAPISLYCGTSINCR